jgi:hypothetical protein
MARLRLSAVLASGALLLLAVTPAFAWEYVVGPPKEEPVPWLIQDAPGSDGPRTMTVTLNTGTCSGEKPPVAGPVSVVELPISAAHPRPTAIITTHQIVPAPVEVSGEVKPGEPGPACADLGYSIPKRIKLKRPVAGMVFLDGFYSPPRRVKPPAGAR